MIVVKIELWPGGDQRKARELGCMCLANDAHTTQQNPKRGSYNVRVFRKNSTHVLRKGRVDNFPRHSYNIWRLVLRALRSAFPEEK